MIRARSGKTAAGRLLLGAGVLALLIPAIAGCEAGSDAPTLEFHPAAAGAQATFNGIQISNAFVLGAPSGSTVPSGSSASMFVSLYNGGASSDTLLSATAAGAATSVTLSGGTVMLPSDAAVNLTGPEPEVVLEKLTVPLTGGSTIPVTFDFQHAGTVTMQVPVEPQSYYYSTYSAPAATPTASVSPSGSPTVTPTGAGGTGQPTSSATDAGGTGKPTSSASATTAP